MLKGLWFEVRGLAIMAVAYYVFTLAHFSTAQAMPLALLTTVVLQLVFLTDKINKKAQRSRFEPFRVSIMINWKDLLRDHKLIDEEGWKRLGEEFRDPATRPGQRFLFEPITSFTRLSSTLTYVDDVKAFTTEIEWHQNLSEIEPKEKRDRSFEFHPSFYIKESSDEHPAFGKIRILEFGLVTLESSHKSVHWMDDRKYIPIAKLPDALFNGYYADDNFDLNLKVAKNVPALLIHYGWEEEKEPEDYDGPPTAEELNHRYVTIWYEGI